MRETKVYYLGTGTEFIKAQCKEYKTLDGVLKAAAKDESLVVWDSNGNVIGSLTDDVPDGALEEGETTEENAGEAAEQDSDSENAETGEETQKEDEGANISLEEGNGQNEANSASENDSEENPEEQQETHIVEQVKGNVIARVVCDGTLNLRRSASFETGNECGRATKGQTYYCKAIHTINGKKMVETIDGLFLSAAIGHVKITEIK